MFTMVSEELNQTFLKILTYLFPVPYRPSINKVEVTSTEVESTVELNGPSLQTLPVMKTGFSLCSFSLQGKTCNENTKQVLANTYHVFHVRAKPFHSCP